MFYQINQYQKVHLLNNNLYIGNMPPMARVIENVPKYLPNLIEWLSNPKSDREIQNYLLNECRMSTENSNKLLKELKESNIIVSSPNIPNDRYARHYLYYNMIGVDAVKLQDNLSTKKVALVGMGGIGSNIAMNLAGAGIGNLLLIDGDTIELSNLTRQFLYKESDIDTYKVDSAQKNLKQINSEVNIEKVVSKITSKEVFETHLKNCDFVILSADEPSEIHQWIDDASKSCDFAYSSAGYIENYGVIGPLIEPGKTTSYDDYKKSGDLHRFTDNEDELKKNLNTNYQAPSYGPLNTLVSSIQANEAIRFLSGLKTSSYSTRLLINSENYEIIKEEF